MSYVWRSEWIWMYESIWGSIEKFKYANALTSSDLCKLVNGKSSRDTFYIYPSLYGSNNTIDIKAICKVLNKDLFKGTCEELKQLLGSLYNAPDLKKYMLDTWRYCPQCICIGYHSLSHQLSFFDKCIFHNIKLQTKCPNCKTKTSYIIKYKGEEHGFKCTCRYDYLLNATPLEIFKLWNNSTIYDNTHNYNMINIHFPANNNISYAFSSFAWFVNKHIIQDYLYSTRDTPFLKNLNSEKLPFDQITNFKIDLKYIPIPKYNDSIYDDSKFIMMNEYVSIFKCIAKHIRKKLTKKQSLVFFKSNKFYLLFESLRNQTLVDGLCFKDIDVQLYAYIMWRKEVEGHEYFNTIHTLQPCHRSNDDRLFPIKKNITGTWFYKYIVNEFQEYIESYKKNEYVCFEDYGALVGTFERIIGKVLLKYYRYWIFYGLEMKKRNPDDIIDFKASIMPPLIEFIIKYEKDKKNAQLISLEINYSRSHYLYTNIY